ncbi:uncharacterized protein [Temnothorax nylanderi]|uniref:uncharacterized protein n=1 Tax=Temnothorax nylanderi TaxID=102681 RepID=UPI003A85278A
MSKKVCVFCGKRSQKILDFTNEKLEKCAPILNIRKEYKLKFSNVTLPKINSSSKGYHSACYQSFTALNNKYKKDAKIEPQQSTSREIDEGVASTSRGSESIECSERVQAPSDDDTLDLESSNDNIECTSDAQPSDSAHEENKEIKIFDFIHYTNYFNKKNE